MKTLVSPPNCKNNYNTRSFIIALCIYVPVLFFISHYFLFFKSNSNIQSEGSVVHLNVTQIMQQKSVQSTTTAPSDEIEQIRNNQIPKYSKIKDPQLEPIEQNKKTKTKKELKVAKVARVGKKDAKDDLDALGEENQRQPEQYVFGQDATKGFLIDIKNAIDKNIEYPKKALMLKKEGIVIIKFLVNSTGNVIKVFVVKSSGAEVLDRSAISTIYKASYLFPRRGKPYFITIPIKYTIS